jgi:hypothetical protein
LPLIEIKILAAYISCTLQGSWEVHAVASCVRTGTRHQPLALLDHMMVFSTGSQLRGAQLQSWDICCAGMVKQRCKPVQGGRYARQTYAWWLVA